MTDTRQGPIHRLWPNTNACLCGWVSCYAAPSVIKDSWKDHVEQALAQFPANHRAILFYTPRTKSRSPYHKIKCSCGYWLELSNGHRETFYTLEHMIGRFGNHLGKAAQDEKSAAVKRKKALTDLEQEQAAKATEAERHAQAAQIAQAIKNRFIIPDE